MPQKVGIVLELVTVAIFELGAKKGPFGFWTILYPVSYV